jgi:hypothetical protein
MPEEPKSDETGSGDDGPKLNRRTYLGAGALALTGTTGVAFTQQNQTNDKNNTGNGDQGQQNGSTLRLVCHITKPAAMNIHSVHSAPT